MSGRMRLCRVVGRSGLGETYHFGSEETSKLSVAVKEFWDLYDRVLRTLHLRLDYAESRLTVASSSRNFSTVDDEEAGFDPDCPGVKEVPSLQSTSAHEHRCNTSLR